MVESTKHNIMGNFENTKTMIDANIKPNGKQEITGMMLNGVLNQIVSDTEREVEKKLDKDKIATINGQRLDEGGNLVLTPGESYDDTEIQTKLTELSEEVSGLSERVDELEKGGQGGGASVEGQTLIFSASSSAQVIGNTLKL